MLAVLAVSLALAPPGLSEWQSMRSCVRKQLQQSGQVDLQYQYAQRSLAGAVLLDHIVGKDAILAAQKCGRAKVLETIPEGCGLAKSGSPIKGYQIGAQTFVCDYDDEIDGKGHIAIVWSQDDSTEPLSLQSVLAMTKLPGCVHPALSAIGAWPLVSMTHDRQRMQADTKPEKALTSELAKKLKSLPPPVDFVRRASGWTWLSTPLGEEDPDKVEQSSQGTLISCGTGQKANDPNAAVAEQLDEAIAALLAPKSAGDQKAKSDAFGVLKKNSSAATEKLLALLTEETSATLTNPNLLLALGRLGEPGAIEPLRRAVESSSEATAKIAAQALAEHPHADALTALTGLLDTGSDAVLTATAPAVVLRKDKAACPSVQSAQERVPDNKAVRDALARLRCGKKK